MSEPKINSESKFPGSLSRFHQQMIKSKSPVYIRPIDSVDDNDWELIGFVREGDIVTSFTKEPEIGEEDV